MVAPAASEPVYTPIDEEVPGNSSIEYPMPASGLPEAGGIAFLTFHLPNGFQVNVTERRENGMLALDAVMALAHYAEERYGLTSPQVRLQTPSATTPATPPAAPTSPATLCKVQAVKHIKSKAQKHMVVVLCAEYPEGVLAFDKQIPAGIDFMAWTLFQEYQPPAGMEYVNVDPVKKWATGFQKNP
jgi:hypothetical protein